MRNRPRTLPLRSSACAWRSTACRWRRARRCSRRRGNERVIAGAYVERGGVCPMLAAHRAAGAQTSSPSRARGIASRGRARSRPATERELRILVTQLRDSLASSAVWGWTGDRRTPRVAAVDCASAPLPGQAIRRARSGPAAASSEHGGQTNALERSTPGCRPRSQRAPEVADRRSAWPSDACSLVPCRPYEHDLRHHTGRRGA